MSVDVEGEIDYLKNHKYKNAAFMGPEEKEKQAKVDVMYLLKKHPGHVVSEATAEWLKARVEKSL